MNSDKEASGQDEKPRLGVVSYNPIQYHAPLWQLVSARENVELDVLFLSDSGISPISGSAFDVDITWDIDLLSGYAHQFLTAAGQEARAAQRVIALAHWIAARDVVVVNGYTSPWMLLTMAICRVRGIPYLLRGSSHPDGRSSGIRRQVRNAVTRLVVAASAGGLSMGSLNSGFYRQNRARAVFFAPNSVDNERFGSPPAISRSDQLAAAGLKDGPPVIIFSGKLIPRKRPLDLVAAVRRMRSEANVLFVGDGSLADRIRAELPPDMAVVTGFVNQRDIPAYYHAADILVLPSEVEAWGLVVNEAMAAGVVPVVSDRVGCGPDLVADAGEIFRCGDVGDLAGALDRALARAAQPGARDLVRKHAARYSLERTAEGFERAARAVSRTRRVRSP